MDNTLISEDRVVSSQEIRPNNMKEMAIFAIGILFAVGTSGFPFLMVYNGKVNMWNLCALTLLIWFYSLVQIKLSPVLSSFLSENYVICEVIFVAQACNNALFFLISKDVPYIIAFLLDILLCVIVLLIK